VSALADDLAYTLVFGRVLARMRERKGLSQSELAKRSLITQGTLSRIEAGRIRPDIVTARRLALALGVTYEHLSSVVESALDRTRAYAGRVTDKPSSTRWLDELVVLAGTVGLIAMALLAVESLMKEETPVRRRKKK
jgi:transcriptional regulator with XRE-family HTH domain